MSRRQTLNFLWKRPHKPLFPINSEARWTQGFQHYETRNENEDCP
jgi:hypothetical protein